MDLSIRRSSESGELVVDLGNEYDNEEEKENRRSIDNNSNICRIIGSSPDREDIVCAPSIPYMLSTSSTSSTPSPSAISPTSSPSLSHSKRVSEVPQKRFKAESGSNSPSPKPHHSNSPKSPRRTPNGVININNCNIKVNSEIINNQKKVIVSPTHNSMQEHNNNTTIIKEERSSTPSSKSSHAHVYHPSVITAKHTTGKSVSNPASSIKMSSSMSTVITPPVSIPLLPLTSQASSAILATHRAGSGELLNPAALIPLLTSEMALRMAAELPALQNLPQPPQVLVKQGVSKCRECNIVFCKHENYIAHKRHYCSARLENTNASNEEGANLPSPLSVAHSPSGMSNSNPASSPTNSNGKETRTASPPANLPPAQQKTLFQFICGQCGIKFTSLDNLKAHQAYYCPKRVECANIKTEATSEKPARKCPKCKVSFKSL